MGVILSLTFVFDPFVKGTVMWKNLFSNTSSMSILFGEQILLIFEIAHCGLRPLSNGHEPQTGFL